MKKNIQKIPKDIYKKIETIKENEIVAGCAVKFKFEDIASGKLAHLGITIDEKGLLALPDSIIPTAKSGKYSERNIHGSEIIRKDLPKEIHYNSIESPNWGDSYNGTHTVNLPYKKFPREFEPPRELEIIIKSIDVNKKMPSYIIAFQVGEVLDKKEKKFSKKLLGNLNILQENIGSCGVESASIGLDEYVKSLYVSWDILPPDTVAEVISRVFQGKNPTPKQKDETTKRYNFFMRLKPKELVFGKSGFRRYFGALIEDDLVVFENIEYGNAIYILFDKWEDLSKLSRVDLLSGKFGNSFDRVVHNKNWEKKVVSIIKSRRKK